MDNIKVTIKKFKTQIKSERFWTSLTKNIVFQLFHKTLQERFLFLEKSPLKSLYCEKSLLHLRYISELWIAKFPLRFFGRRDLGFDILSFRELERKRLDERRELARN